jgi:predicted O-linked N-acetylglucosamine transferase (SPINDLY family)
MRHMDYFLSGRRSEPDAAQDHYTERLLLIDGPAHCFDFTGEALPAPSQRLDRKSFEIPDEAIVFASGANFHKIIPEVERAWIDILERVPGSRLLLYPFNLNWSKSYPAESFLERFRAAAAARGVSDQRLLVFPASSNRADVFERLRLADLYLDTFPFSGATSLLDPLQVGLPVIAMDGASFRARVGPALLRAIGLDELVAPDSGAYIELACQLAGDPSARENLRARLRKAMRARPKFLDTHWFGVQVQEILTKVWAERAATNFAPLAPE